MQFKYTNLNSFWAYLLIEELLRNGVNYFCISPGSRSTPLTVAVADNKNARSIICYDERGAAFHALGYAKNSGIPAVLICTSGTALANYFPAVIEARQSGTPLIILSADRPPELRYSGANQTIDQIKIFGDTLNWFFDLPAPDLQINAEFLLTTIDQAVSCAMHQNKAAVHINCMFREPLEPKLIPVPLYYIERISQWESTSTPYTQGLKGYQKIDRSEIEKLAGILNNSKQGLLVVGRLGNKSQKNAVKKIAEKSKWPVFADITSGLRASTQSDNLITHFDQILLEKGRTKITGTDTILHIGAPLTSNRFLKFSTDLKGISYIRITQDSDRQDPGHSASHSCKGDIGQICLDLLPLLKSKPNKILASLQKADKKIFEILKSTTAGEQQISEISVARLISAHLPDSHCLFLGNSMPIRDFDMYADFKYLPVCIGSNRGASGIDGTIASALGFAAGSGGKITLVLGDLALIHDLNSLHQINNSEGQVIIIVINNYGGGIFSFLPISQYNEIFEKYFSTPHQLNLNKAAEMFGLDYANPETNRQLIDVYNKYIKNKKSVMIEVITDRTENMNKHKDIQKKIISIL